MITRENTSILTDSFGHGIIATNLSYVEILIRKSWSIITLSDSRF